MRAAGAHDYILKYINEEHSCSQCNIPTRQANRRRAHCPRSFAFNKLISVDVFYIKFRDTQTAILNMVCAGTNYHVVQRLPVADLG
jgi:hypothetical protein